MPAANSNKLVQNSLKKLQNGKFDAATKAALAGLKQFPNNPDLLAIAGNAASEAGNHSVAAKAFSALIKQRPGATDVKVQLGLALIQAGQTEAAHVRVSAWLADHPGNPDIRFLLALIALANSDHPLTEHEATVVLTDKPDMERALAVRGLARFEQQKFDLALLDFEAADQLAPGQLETLLNIGFCHKSMLNDSAAIAAFEKCISVAPEDVAARANLAEVLEQTGEFDGALKHHLAIWATHASNWTALRRIVELGDVNSLTQQLEISEARFRALRKNAPEEAAACLAMAHLHEKLGDWPSAERHYQKSNALQARVAPFDPEAETALLEKTFELFPKDHTPRSGGDEETPGPVFVLGLPRSGTTLMDLLLSAHADVLSFGELGAMEDIARDAMRVGKFDPQKAAQDFRAEIPGQSSPYSLFTDKMPSNYMYVGFLAEAFPTARFIHIVRDPRETAFSMWKIHFAGSFLTYTSRMDWLAHATNLYKRYMNRWYDLYPDRILSVSYRDLVTDTKAVSREVAAFCALEWQEAMARPSENASAARTSSVVQVRKQLHSRSLGSWEPHKALLQPFVDGLDPDLWPELAFAQTE